METIVKSMLDGLTQEQQQSILSILFCYIIHHIVIRVSHCVTIFKMHHIRITNVVTKASIRESK